MKRRMIFAFAAAVALLAMETTPLWSHSSPIAWSAGPAAVDSVTGPKVATTFQGASL